MEVEICQKLLIYESQLFLYAVRFLISLAQPMMKSASVGSQSFWHKIQFKNADRLCYRQIKGFFSGRNASGWI